MMKKGLSAFSALVLLLILVAGLAVSAIPQEYRALPDRSGRPQEQSADERETLWEITAERVQANHTANIIEAWGDVTVWQGDNALKADYARYFADTHWILLQGNVKTKWQADYLESSEAEFDLHNKTGWLKEGTLLSTDPHIHFSGQHIEKLEGNTYAFKEAMLTACDKTPAPWSLKAKEGVINLDGNAEFQQASLRIEDTPVLYTPYALVPVMLKRQSGLLIPDFSVSSRLGVEMEQPYYIVLDEEHDMTLYENYMTKRGFMQGLEYRLATDPRTLGVFRADWLYDNETILSQAEEESEFGNTGLTRANHNRYWLRGKYNGFLADPAWQTKLDLDYVSDINYLREFNRGMTGFSRNRDDFLNLFKRDIAENDSLTRNNTALLSRDFEKFGVAGMLQYNENLAYKNNLPSDQDPTVQRLPELSAYFFRDRIGDSPLEWQADNTMDYFWRNYGSTGGRLDLHPSAVLPLDYKGYSFIPRVGMRETAYSVETYKNEAPDSSREDFQTRSVPDFNLSTFTEYFRVFDFQSPLVADASTVGQSSWTKLKHAIQPRVSYDYIPHVDQSSIPVFDAVDRIEPTNMITYSLTNILTRRRDMVLGKPDDAGALQYNTDRDYLELVNLRLEQSYDFREAGRTDEIDTYPRRPFSDILADLTTRFNKHFSLINRTSYSPYENLITEHEHLLRYEHEDYGAVWSGLDYLKPLNEYKRQTTDIAVFDATHLNGLTYDQYKDLLGESFDIVRLGGEAFLSQKLHLGVDYRFDYKHDTDISKDFYLTYNDQCYNLRMDFNQSSTDTRFAIRVDLLSLMNQSSPQGAGPAVSPDGTMNMN